MSFDEAPCQGCVAEQLLEILRVSLLSWSMASPGPRQSACSFNPAQQSAALNLWFRSPLFMRSMGPFLERDERLVTVSSQVHDCQAEFEYGVIM